MPKTRVVANTLFQVLNRGIVVLVSFLTTAFLTRALGTSGYGDYVFITSFILLFVSLSDLGITVIGISEAANEKEKIGFIFSQVLVLRIILSLFLFLAYNLVTQFLPQFQTLREPTFWASFVVVFLVLRTTSQAILQTHLRMDLASVLEVFSSLIFLFFLLVYNFRTHSVSLPFLMIIWSLSALISGVAGYFISSRYTTLYPRFNFNGAMKLFKNAAPLGIYLLVYSIYDRGIDSFILKTYFPSDIVGFYGLAYKIHGNLVLGAAFLMNSLFPLLASFKTDIVALKKLYQKALTVLFLVALLVVFLGFIFAPLVIKTIGGVSFLSSISIFRILLIATFFAYLNHLTGYTMIILGEQKKLLLFSLVAFLLNLAVNLIFIPLFSMKAAAAVTILTELMIFLLTQKFLEKKYHLNFSFSDLSNSWHLLWQKKLKYFD
ncbi:MAG: oligosaccharide flippase family protein [Patescibacteria group bacterium]|nr:oligosaccharide flippase family protein [Patescibacteria group bacterium]